MCLIMLFKPRGKPLTALYGPSTTSCPRTKEVSGILSLTSNTQNPVVPNPMIPPAASPSITTQGPPLEPFHTEQLTPKVTRWLYASALSKVPGAKVLVVGFATTLKFIDLNYHWSLGQLPKSYVGANTHWKLPVFSQYTISVVLDLFPESIFRPSIVRYAGHLSSWL